jgi:hypothetical protein
VITIAGGGPSTKQVKRVDVATKKQRVPSDYIFCRSYDTVKPYLKNRGPDYHPPLIIYKKGCGCAGRKCGECKEKGKRYVDKPRWDAYYRDFSLTKPSLGLLAVFGVVELWNPKTIGLIGYDWILDGNPEWTRHDAEAEKKAIMSLVRIIDLR